MKKRLVMRNVLISFLKPRNGYERLLRAIRHVREVPANTSLKEVVFAIRNGHGQPPLTEEDHKKIEEAIVTLREKEELVLRRYYGINRKPETLAAIAKSWKRSPERIRQIRNKALRLLRHPARGSDIAKMPIAWEELFWFQKEVGELKDTRLKLEEARDKLEKYKKIADEVWERYKEAVEQVGNVLEPLIPITSEKLEKYDVPTSVFKKSIDELNLSVRSYNCLRGAGIKTIGQLCSRNEDQLLKTKNFGRKSLSEIKAELVNLGLYLNMDLSLHKT